MKKLLSLSALLLIAGLCAVAQNETIHLTTAGTLDSLVNKSDTSLAVTGNIDARDFVTMRDSMPNLTHVDLSGANIVGYIGTQGTDPSTLTYYDNEIPIGAFGCITYQHITTISLPPVVTAIGLNAFCFCNYINSISIPASTTFIGTDAFAACGAQINVDANNAFYSSIDGVLFNKAQDTLISCPRSKTGTYVVPNTVKVIGYNSFYLCQIDSINIPTSVSVLGPDAFYNCSLTSCTLPASVTYIGEDVFRYCPYNCMLTFIMTLLAVPIDLTNIPQVFYGVYTNSCKLYVPYGCESAYQSANQWKDFTHIIGMDGFWVSTHNVLLPDAGGIDSITVKANVSWSVSSNQSWLTISNASGTNNGTIIITAEANSNGTFRVAEVTVAANGIPSQTIIVVQGNTVTVSAGNLNSLLSPLVKNSINTLVITGTIDARDFVTMRDSMPNLANIDLSKATIVDYDGYDGTDWSGNYEDYPANEIPVYAFMNPSIGTGVGKSSPQSIVLSNSDTAIAGGAFNGCYNLNAITIPASITSIGHQSSSGFINVEASNPNYSSIDGVLYDKAQDTLIQCPTSKTGIFTIPNTVKVIDDYAFYNCSELTSVSIPPSVTSVGYYAFNNCTNITSMHVPTQVTYIGQEAFANCSSLTSISISQIRTINDYVFYACSNLITITIPSSVDSIGYAALSYCTSLTSVIIPSSVVFINEGVFYEDHSLTSIYSFASTPVNLSASPTVFYDVDTTKCTLYVPYGSKAAYQAANQWKAFTHIVEMSGLWLSDTLETLENVATSKAIVDVSSNTTWTAGSNQSWLTVSPNAATNGNGTINCTATANQTATPRTAIITVSATGLASQTISVTQVGTGTETTAVPIIPTETKHYKVVGNTVLFSDKESAVYSMLGVRLSPTGSMSVTLPAGVYVVQTADGAADKIVVGR